MRRLKACRFSLLFFGWILIASVGQCQQDELSEMELIERVASLQQQLSHPEIDKRQDAEKQLLKLGVKALDYLEPVSPKTSSDAIERLARVRVALEKIAAVTVVEPTRVSIKRGQQTVESYIASIVKQTGNELVVNQEALATKVDLELKDATFWEAVEQLCKKANLTPDAFRSEKGKLTLVGSNPNPNPNAKPVNIPQDTSGIFQVVVQRVIAGRNFESPQLSYCNLQVRVRWEPRMTPISLSIPMESIKITDEFGKQVKVPERKRALTASIQPEIPEVEMSIPIGLVDRQIENLKSLEANINAVLPGRIETFKFKKIGRLEPGANQTKAGAKVTLDGIAKNDDDLYGITLTLSFEESKNALESHLSWVYENKFVLMGADGKPRQPLAQESAGRTKESVSIRYYFNEDPSAMTLIYETPAAIVTVPAKIVLKKIPLP